VGEAIKYAKVLGVRQLNCLVGILPQNVKREQARNAGGKPAFRGQCAGAGTYRSADRADQHVRHPRLLPVAHAAGDRPDGQVNAPNLFVQYDIYHMQRMEGELANTIRANLPKIGTCSWPTTPAATSPAPARSTTVPVPHLDEIGYQGWIGCEYKPKTTTEAGLGWRGARRLSRRSAEIRIEFFLLTGDKHGKPTQRRLYRPGHHGRAHGGHLRAAGHTLFVHDVNPAPQFLVDAGVTVCTSAEEVAKRADIVIVMVPDTPHVEAVLFGEGACAAKGRQGPTARSWST
jgi:hypothetical protein